MMKVLMPNSIAGRTLIVLILGLVVSHILSVAIYTTDRRSAINLVGGEHISERMITLARLIEGADAPDREELARLASESILNVSLGDEPRISETVPKNLEEQILTEVFAEHLSRYGVRDFRLRYRDITPADTAQETGPMSRYIDGAQKLMQVSLRLQGGGWLNCSALIETTSSPWSPRFLLSLAVMTIAVMIVSGIVVYHINGPLRIFSQAAHRLGTNIDAPPLPVAGPREVQDAIRSFNDMQERLKRLISDRRQMLAAVSHDLRTPITLLRLRAEFVENEDEREKMLATLSDMEAMVESILGFIRDDATEEDVRSVDLASLLNAICDDINDLGGEIVFRGPDRLIYPCRPTVLKRALTNVIDNAVKFGSRAEVLLRATPETIAIVVEDEGPGIPEAEIETVFNPFFRIEASRSRDTGGVGLGLSVARSIIGAHGGSISLANRETGGLRATIELPGGLESGAEDAIMPRSDT
tara:strand:- start:448 stop:1863 length:1416 start_codon:yes stop_codon:yes gene_type:complete